MSQLVSIQTLRGNAGLVEAQKVVEAAVAKRNSTAAKDDQHVVEVFAALPPNTKGMQIQLSLLAVMAREGGCNLIRLNVHNGNVALCGLQNDVDQVRSQWTPTYSILATKAMSAYTPAAHGPKMGFTNGYICGLIAGLQSQPAELAYGIGSLFSFPKPGSGTAYDLGFAASQAVEVAPATAPKSRTSRKSKEVAAA